MKLHLNYSICAILTRRFFYNAEEKISKMLKLFQEHVYNKFEHLANLFFRIVDKSAVGDA